MCGIPQPCRKALQIARFARNSPKFPCFARFGTIAADFPCTASILNPFASPCRLFTGSLRSFAAIAPPPSPHGGSHADFLRRERAPGRASASSRPTAQERLQPRLRRAISAAAAEHRCTNAPTATHHGEQHRRAHFVDLPWIYHPRSEQRLSFRTALLSFRTFINRGQRPVFVHECSCCTFLSRSNKPRAACLTTFLFRSDFVNFSKPLAAPRPARKVDFSPKVIFRGVPRHSSPNRAKALLAKPGSATAPHASGHAANTPRPTSLGAHWSANPCACCHPYPPRSLATFVASARRTRKARAASIERAEPGAARKDANFRSTLVSIRKRRIAPDKLPSSPAAPRDLYIQPQDAGLSAYFAPLPFPFALFVTFARCKWSRMPIIAVF